MIYLVSIELTFRGIILIMLKQFSTIRCFDKMKILRSTYFAP